MVLAPTQTYWGPMRDVTAMVACVQEAPQVVKQEATGQSQQRCHSRKGALIFSDVGVLTT